MKSTGFARAAFGTAAVLAVSACAARISDLIFPRYFSGMMSRTAEVHPYYCVELGARMTKAFYLIQVERTSEANYHVGAATQRRSAVCHIEPGQGHDFPELLARKNASGDS